MEKWVVGWIDDSWMTRQRGGKWVHRWILEKGSRKF